MNKSIFTLILLTFLASHGLAQNDRYQDDNIRDKIKIGIKAGANLANVYDTEGEDFDAEGKWGLAFGGFISIPIGTYLGVQPEVLFSQKGFTATGRVLGNEYDLKRTLNYLDIPLLFALKPVSFITVLAGPQFSFLMKRTDAFSGDTFTLQQQESFTNQNIRKNMIGFTGGIDVNVKNVVVGARIGWDLLRNDGEGGSATPRYKNTWVQATLGLRIY